MSNEKKCRKINKKELFIEIKKKKLSKRKRKENRNIFVYFKMSFIRT